MRSLAELSCGYDFVLLFPDVPDLGEQDIRSSLGEAGIIAKHSSGRPWIAGRVHATKLVTVRHRESQMAIIGEYHRTQADLEIALSEFVKNRDIESLRKRIGSGSFLVCVALGDRMVAAGTASGSERFYYRRHNGCTVMADRPDVLAGLTGYELDDSGLAIRMLPFAPHPLLERQVWSGVHEVPPGSVGTVRYPTPDHIEIQDWWRAPDCTQGLGIGATAWRNALEEAVQVRTRNREHIGSDLSGGFDSAILSLLAREFTSGRFTTFSIMDDSDDEDPDQQTIHELRNILKDCTHVTIDENRQLPAPLYSGMLGSENDLLFFDQPNALQAEGSLTVILAESVRDTGVTLKFSGSGGDVHTRPPGGHLHDLIRMSNPIRAAKDIRSYQRIHHWSTFDTIRHVMDRRSYCAWLAGSADKILQSSPFHSMKPPTGWMNDLLLPPWVTAEAVADIRNSVCNAAEDVEPLARNRGVHNFIEDIRFSTHSERAERAIYNSLGMTLATPFYDDDVVDAALAIHPAERYSVHSYKILAKAAFRDKFPPSLADRNSKLFMTQGAFRKKTLSTFPRLLEAFESSVLAERGLVDLRQVHAHLRNPALHSATPRFLPQLVALEHWLRQIKSG
ncbi:asparagine synthase-related protein [Streptomyces rubiginosohelvolus]|uniref:asparagine synthase-related protein n=1 Tax=Streptomyces rubiginosohelvolus TaxID=67362 RepID=UPI0036811BB4